MINFDILKAAGVSQGQFGKLVGVSRVTVNTWVRKGHKPHKSHAAYVERALTMLTRAVDQKILPVSVESPADMTQRILDAIASSMKG